jgi:tetratricopeptide (TPR) repeat protein
VLLDGADPALAAAIEAARQRVRHDPSSAAAWADLGKLLRGASHLTPAAVCFAQAARLDSADPRWLYLQGESLRQSDPAAALDCLRRAVAAWDSQGGTAVAPRLQLVEALLEVGRYEEAEDQLNRGLQADPNNPSLWLARGELAWAQGDAAASRAHLLKCQDSPHTRQRACARLAAVCRRLGAMADAERFRRRAAALPADQPWLDPYVWECLQTTVGRPERFYQIEALERQRRYPEAIALLRELTAGPPDARVYAALGRDLAQTGDLAGAEQNLRRAVELAPDSVQNQYALSKLLLARGDAAGAADAARKALDRKPDHGLAHLLLGRALRAQGEHAKALVELRRAVECSPDAAEAWLYLGEALAAQGQSEEARKCLQEAADLAGPDDRRPAAAMEKLKGVRGVDPEKSTRRP